MKKGMRGGGGRKVVEEGENEGENEGKRERAEPKSLD